MIERHKINIMKKDMAEYGIGDQIENALDIIYFIGIGQDLAWRKGEGIIKSDISINKLLWDYLKQEYISEGHSRYGNYGIFLLEKSGEEIFQELLELKKPNFEKFKNEFININPKIFSILLIDRGINIDTGYMGGNIDTLCVKDEFEILFLNSKEGNKLKNFLDNKMDLLYSLFKKYDLYVELTPFQSNRRNYSKNRFINNEDVYRLLLEYIDNFPKTLYCSITELNNKISFFNDLINSIENYKIREKLDGEYSNYIECKYIIDNLKTEKITTSFSSNPPYFKIINEQKFRMKIEGMKQDYIDKISGPIIDYLLDVLPPLPP